MPQILLYGEKEMHVFAVVGYYPQPVGSTVFDVATLEDMYEKKAIIPNRTYQAEITTGEVKAELDPTTMKRIAKYNLDKDFEELNKEIKSAEERLEMLNKEAEKKKEKLKLMDELFLKILNDRDFDQNDYLTVEYEEE